MTERRPDLARRLQQAAELGQTGQPAAALQELLALIGEMPELAAAHFGAAEMLYRMGQRDGAIDRLQAATALDPDNPLATMRLAGWLIESGQQNDFADALRILAAACQRSVGNVELWAEYFHALFDHRRYPEALQAVDRALALAPQSASLHTNRAAVLFKLNRLDESYQEDKNALVINPGLVAAHNGLILTCVRMGFVEEAEATIEWVSRQQPDNAENSSRALFLTNARDTFAAAENFARHREWARRFEVPQRRFARPAASNFLPGRRLKIGYVSPDFVRHSVSYFIEPVLAHHDRGAFELFAYHCSPTSDAITARLRRSVDHWHNVARLGFVELGELIRQDGIDILIDLAGHTANHRLQTFALKPAPVQMSYLGYPNTTGLDAIDYRITDERADPSIEGGRFSSEVLLRLPDCFHCYQAEPDLPPATVPPVEKNGRITFGSCNVLGKISDPTIDAWSGILRLSPGAMLRLKSFGLVSTLARSRLLARFAAAGVAAERIILDAATVTHQEHMARYGSIDIALDTFPYNGTTTTCEALWMGVPVITLAGDRHAARVGASLLNAAGLAELIATSPADYVQRAVTLAGDRQRLSHYHATLRNTLERSPLTDGARLTAHLEQAYREAWANACRQAAAIKS